MDLTSHDSTFSILCSKLILFFFYQDNKGRREWFIRSEKHWTRHQESWALTQALLPTLELCDLGWVTSPLWVCFNIEEWDAYVIWSPSPCQLWHFLHQWYNTVLGDLHSISILALDLVWVNLACWLTGENPKLTLYIYEHIKGNIYIKDPTWYRGHQGEHINKGGTGNSGEQCL